MTERVGSLAADFRNRSVRALARSITMVERRDPDLYELLSEVPEPSAAARVAGVTGAPGVGKSTLVDALISDRRSAGKTVGVIAVDPSSPYTGGALLGDRVRMQKHTLDEGVYIRSMGARGHLGGLSLAVREALHLLLSFGFDHVLIETVGAGQSEMEIAGVAETTVVVLAPGMGDSIQVNKAGIMEIADIFVVNKSDRDGADQLVRDVRNMLNLGTRRAWRPPIVKTEATSGMGVAALWDAIGQHRAYIDSAPDEAASDARLRSVAAGIVADLARSRTEDLLVEDVDLMARLRRERLPHLIAPLLLERCAR